MEGGKRCKKKLINGRIFLLYTAESLSSLLGRCYQSPAGDPFSLPCIELNFMVLLGGLFYKLIYHLSVHDKNNSIINYY